MRLALRTPLLLRDPSSDQPYSLQCCSTDHVATPHRCLHSATYQCSPLVHYLQRCFPLPPLRRRLCALSWSPATARDAWATSARLAAPIALTMAPSRLCLPERPPWFIGLSSPPCFDSHCHSGTGAGRRRLPLAALPRAAPPACWRGVTVALAPPCPPRVWASRRWYRAACPWLFRCTYLRLCLDCRLISCSFASAASCALAWGPPFPWPFVHWGFLCPLLLCSRRPWALLRFRSPLFGCSSLPARLCGACSCRCFAPSSPRPRAPVWSPLALDASLCCWLRHSSSAL